MKRIALGVQYDGTPWNGYQKQLSRNTVQDRLEIALKEFARTDLATTCAGRTDTGVHAIEQVVHFDTDLERDMNSWVRGVNAFLPDSIAVRWATEIPHDPEHEFHARFSARARTYHYVLYNNPVRSPLLVGRAGFTFRPLDVGADARGRAAPGRRARLLGVPLVAVPGQVADQADARGQRRAARRGAGVHAARQRLPAPHGAQPDRLADLRRQRPPSAVLAGRRAGGRDRNDAAPTFMPDGLYLAKIDYDPKWGLPQEASSPLPWFAPGR